MSLKFFNLISEATPTPLARGAVAPSSAGKIRASRQQNAPATQNQPPQQNQNTQGKAQPVQKKPSASSAPQQTQNLDAQVDEIYNQISQEIQSCFMPLKKEDPNFLKKAKWLFLLANNNTVVRK